MTACDPTSANGIGAIMSNGRNGQNLTDRDSTRRLRVDDMAAIVVRNSPGPADNAPSAIAVARSLRPALRARGGPHRALDLGNAVPGLP